MKKMRWAIALLALAGALGSSARIAALAPADDDQTIRHVLNRLGYGARPGDVQDVRRTGVMNYIERQLHPERIDDARLEARVARLETLVMSPADLARTSMSPDAPERRLIVAELGEHKLLRAAYSERQLQEVLTDFWFNHFNVFAGKGATRIFVAAYERDAIRPHVFGRFREMLGATARHPAMLFYLDNWMSSAEGGVGGRRPAGLNENYARELLELHTLGVDGGYTEEDIVQVAKAFTGWTLERPRLGGPFRFNPRMHERGDKRVLGSSIREAGQAEGEEILDILARHPSTAKLIAMKLTRRFVSDDPPSALVERAARRFRETDGDLRQVVSEIVTSPEFFAAGIRGKKTKTPFEFVVSALRAADAEVQRGVGLVRELQELGMPLYMAQPPTGYADTADAWINAGGLVGRMNFAVALAENRVPGVRVAAARNAPAAVELGGPEFQRK